MSFLTNPDFWKAWSPQRIVSDIGDFLFGEGKNKNIFEYVDYRKTGHHTGGSGDKIPEYVVNQESSAVKPSSSSSSSGGGGGGNLTMVPPGNSASTTYYDSTTVPEEIYGEWTPYLEYLREESDKNSAWNEMMAERQNAWQRETNQIQMDFNAAEAAKNRDWQEAMSNSAHQREVQDLLAAGLNPVLSATGGNGAAVTSGATASGATSAGTKAEKDNTFVLGLLSFLNNIMGYATSTASAGISAGAVLGAAGINAEATKYASDNAYYSAQNNPQTIYGWARRQVDMMTNASGVGSGLKAWWQNLGDSARGIWRRR